MTDDNREGAADADMLGVGLAALTGMTLSDNPELSAAVVPLVPFAIKRLWGLFGSGRREREQQFLRLVIAGLGVVTEKEIEALAADASMREVIFDAVRVIDNAMCDEAVHAIAKLVIEYRSQAKRGDWFSRGVRRMFEDISSEDFQAFREVLTIVAEQTSAYDDLPVSFYASEDPPVLAMYVRPIADRPGDHKEVPTRSAIDCTARALERLKLGLMVREGSSGAGKGMSGAPHMFLAQTTARRLLGLMPS